MKLSKAVLLASGIGVSSQFSFGSITVSNTETAFQIGALSEISDWLTFIKRLI